jgi:hypothetical protein
MFGGLTAAGRGLSGWREYGLALNCYRSLHVGRSGAARGLPRTSRGRDRGREADLAAIEKFRQQDIAATLSQDPVALRDFWTDDAIRLGVGTPAEVGKKSIRESYENA